MRWHPALNGKSVTMETYNLIVPVIVAILGWYIAHRLSAHRDRLKKRQDERIRYLIEAFRLLSMAVNHPRLCEVNQPLREALSIVQLLGTKKQNSLVAEFIAAIGGDGDANIDELLQDLRNDLRSELDLTPIEDSFSWVWVRPSAEEDDDAKSIGLKDSLG